MANASNNIKSETVVFFKIRMTISMMAH